jgi:hypothetical protein
LSKFPDFSCNWKYFLELCSHNVAANGYNIFPKIIGAQEKSGKIAKQSRLMSSIFDQVFLIFLRLDQFLRTPMFTEEKYGIIKL